MDGSWTKWYENGQKKSEGHYKEGTIDSLLTWWYETGEKKWEGHFVDGKPQSHSRGRE
jgi:antitoxin component YwqK of YwqJK toxin-antitoxin module